MPASPETPPLPDAAFIHGVAAYRRHPYRRMLRDPPVIWTEGSSRLLDYGGHGPKVLFVPSLINRAYILDLDGKRSMLRWLRRRGVRPLLLDWGWPGAEERRFGLEDYTTGRLARAIEAAGPPVVLAGYCMGGLLALAAALRQPAHVRALALLATPWDFHAPDPAPPRLLAAQLPMLAPLLAAGPLPVDLIQAMFTLADPAAIQAKYRAFPHLDPRSERARMFVAIEDWLADGVPLAATVAAEVFGDWYGANSPGRGEWTVGGTQVDPAALRMPTLVALPAQDRIVPPESAAALIGHLPHAAVLRPPAGHVGMVAGAHAAEELWAGLRLWLRGLELPK